MSKHKPVILVLESDEDSFELLEGMLEDEFIVKSLPQNDISVENIKHIDPDAFVVHKKTFAIPVSDICNIVKDQNPKAYIVLLEEDPTLDKQIYAFECGCDDYLASPFNPIEVYHKIKIGVNQRISSRELMNEADDARNMAFSMLEANSELGSVVRFIESIMKTTSFDALGRLLVNVGEAFGISLAAQFRLNHQMMNFNCEQGSDIEKVMTAARGRAKIIETARRLIVNGDSVAIFISAMPESEEKKGRLKDNLSILVNAAESRVQALNAEFERNQLQNKLLDQVVGTVLLRRGNIKDHFVHYDERVHHLVMSFHEQIESLLISMDLDVAQEEKIISQIDIFLKAITDTDDIKKLIKDTLDSLESDLQKIRK